jgi:hypothetical protein
MRKAPESAGGYALLVIADLSHTSSNRRVCHSDRRCLKYTGTTRSSGCAGDMVGNDLAGYYLGALLLS